MRRSARLLPALLATAALAACGGDDEQPAASPADGTQLTVEVTGARAGTIELRCGGAEPCDRRRLDKLAPILRPPDERRACTLVYGGPEKAHVTGTLEGERVDITIDRADGCGIADYEKLFEALGRKPPLAG
jgi:hypothetical protein